MATRCNIKINLEVHHLNRGLTDKEGLNNLSNAQVLCSSCHDNVGQSLAKPKGTPNFSDTTKAASQISAQFKCECTRENCHVKK